MTHLLDRLNNKRSAENGYSLMLAVLLMVIMLAVVASLTATVIAGTQKSGQTRDYTFNSLAADAALNDALLTANTETLTDGVTSLINHIGPENAKTGILSPHENPLSNINWMWYAVPTPSSAPYTDYQIYASGYRGNEPDAERSHHMTARLTSFPVTGAIADSGTGNPVYQLPSRALWSKGAVGVDALTLDGEGSVYSYNSASGTTPPAINSSTPRSSIHTNGNVNFTGNYGGQASEVDFYGFQTGDNFEERCLGNCLLPTRGFAHFFDSANYDNDLSISRDTSNGGFECSSYPNWRSSSNGTVLNPSGNNRHLCFNDLTIDANTTIPTRFTTGAPLTVFVNGDLTFSPGMSLQNAGHLDSSRGPLSLRLVVSGDVDIPGHTTATTTLSGLVIATNGGVCTVGTANRSAEVRGAIACSDLRVIGQGKIWVDSQSSLTEHEQGPTGSSGEDTRAWLFSDYRIISELPG